MSLIAWPPETGATLLCIGLMSKIGLNAAARRSKCFGTASALILGHEDVPKRPSVADQNAELAAVTVLVALARKLDTGWPG